MASTAAGRACRDDSQGEGAAPEWSRQRRIRTEARRLSAAVAAPGLLFWATVLAVLLVDAVWLAAAGIVPALPGFAATAALVAALLAAAAYWGRVRSEPSLRAMALASAGLIAFTVPVAVLHYLAATLARPLVDPSLARIEAALGFDWNAHLAFLIAHPALSWWLALAYHSSGPQVGLVVIALGATRRLGRLWTYLRLFCAGLIAVVVIAALFPALGPYAHYAPTRLPAESLETVGALWHLEPLARLRSGALRTLALSDIRALVTFPSFHVCLAILTAWALAPVRLIGPLAILLNAAVVVATLAAGGHYLPDVLAGAILAGALLAGAILAGARLGLGRARRPALQPGPLRAAEGRLARGEHRPALAVEAAEMRR
jgi:hypothetical protein